MRFRCSVLVLAAALACCSGDEISRATWWPATTPSGTELTVIVATGSSSCDFFDRVDVEETNDTVEVRAFVGHRKNVECKGDMNQELVDVSLESDLGDRTLIGCDPHDVRPAQDCRTTLDGE